MKNRITDLNDHLFAQIERLSNEDLTSDELAREVIRAKALNDVAAQIMDIGRLQLEAIKLQDDIRLEIPKDDMPEFFKQRKERTYINDKTGNN